MQLDAIDPPIIVETDKVLLAHAILRTKKFRQFSRHPEMPPITVQDGADDADGPKHRFEEMKPGTKRIHPFVNAQKLELDKTSLPKNAFAHLLGYLNLLLQSLGQLSIWIESDTYPQMAPAPDGFD